MIDGTRTHDEQAERAASVFPLVDRWLNDPALTELFALFDRPGPAPADWLPPNERLPEWYAPATAPGFLTPDQAGVLAAVAEAEQSADASFNFRKGTGYVERWHAADGDFGADVRDRVLVLAEKLAMVEPAPTSGRSYDRSLILGGGFRSPLLRARFAADLRDGGVDLGDMSFLGSPRPLITDPPEAESAESYAPGAVDEFDLMAAAARTAFGLAGDRVEYLCGCASAEAVCPAWARHHPSAAGTPPAFTHERRLELFGTPGAAPVGTVLSASTGRPPHRPDTADTYDLWARSTRPRPGQCVLVVTTQVFVPFQRFDALRRLHLPHGVEIEAVGYGPSVSRPLTAEYLLQEVLSGVRSARRLLFAAAEVLRGGS